LIVEWLCPPGLDQPRERDGFSLQIRLTEFTNPTGRRPSRRGERALRAQVALPGTTRAERDDDGGLIVSMTSELADG